MTDNELTYFEKRLQIELERIEAQIKTLKSEKSALIKQQAKARAERTGLQAITRKNSINRVLAENSIIEALRLYKKPLSTDELYKNARLTNFDLKTNTFRTYLHRMKKRDLIKTAKHVGWWELTEDKK